MNEAQEHITRFTTQIVAEYRAYFALLHDYRHGNHEKIMERLQHVRELERGLKAIAGNEAGGSLFSACYHTVYKEQGMDT
jgi:hypothetical protein